MREIADTIKEANKLRAELGMPLLEEVDEATVAAAAARDTPAAAPPQQTDEEAALAAQKDQQTLEVMAKIEKAKKKRQQTQVIGKSLGEELAAEDEGVLAWVMKHKVGAVGDNSASSAKQKERELAKRTARMLDDTDKLLEEDEGPQRRQPAAKKRRSSGRSGAPVPAVIAHRPEDLQEGEIVMVLKDASVLAGANDLNEEEDELENINLLELQKAKEFQERKRKKPIYDVYGDLDSGKKSILAQYDEKPERAKFKLDEEGRVEVDVDAKLDRVRERLNANKKMLYDLSEPTAALSSEFYSHEELASFKKPTDKKQKKTRRKKLRKKPTTAELIAAMETEADEGEGEDHGSRQEKSVKQRRDEAERSAEVAKRKEGWSKATERAREESRSIYGTKGVKEEPDDEDEAVEDVEDDLYSAVSKARRAALTKRSQANVAQSIAASRTRSDEKVSAGDGGLVLSATTEFCASLTTEGLALKAKKKRKQREEEQEEAMEEEAQPELKQEEKMDEEEKEEEERPKSGFRVVEPGKATTSTTTSVTKRIIKAEAAAKAEPRLESVVPEEPLVAKGLAATLQLLNQQGGMKSLELDSVSGRARDKVLEIPDSDDPAPNIRIDKYDEFGRKMTPREAFRHLSHRFHGKMPGKKKTEKRLQKYEDDLKKKKMSSLDTPLMSLQAMQKAQEVAKAPYVLLSSTSATISRGGLDLSKPEK